MHTTFKEIDLNLIRYSLVWEGHETLYNGLDISNDDNLLIITSAGGNVLNALLKAPANITAIDINPEQNRLLEFKKELISKLEYESFIKLMGFRNPGDALSEWNQVKTRLSTNAQSGWDLFFQHNPDGIAGSGKLEKYLNAFYHSLSDALQLSLQELFQFEQIDEQVKFFYNELDNSAFKQQFINYFDNQNLSKGRDPKLFEYVKESGGLTFYKRLENKLKHHILKNNFHARMLFFGSADMPETILPLAYQEENYQLLRDQLPKLIIVTSEVMEYLLGFEQIPYNKMALSNIFEYTTTAECNKELQLIHSKMQQKPYRLLFWNLLQLHHVNGSLHPHFDEQQSAELTENESCFYFGNVVLLNIN